MKNRIIVFAACALLCLLLASCAGQGYQDGIYLSSEQEFSASGWKDFVEVKIEDGKLAKVSWDSVYKDSSIPIRKKQYSKSGLYGMLLGGASAEWYDQAIAAEQFAIESGIDKMIVNSEGYTDVISGCTVHVNGFEKMLRHCLEQAKK